MSGRKAGRPPANGPKPITRKHMQFVKHYLKTGSQTEAAIYIGHTGSRKALAVSGSRIMARPEVQAYLKSLLDAGDVDIVPSLARLQKIVETDADGEIISTGNHIEAAKTLIKFQGGFRNKDSSPMEMPTINIRVAGENEGIGPQIDLSPDEYDEK